MQLFFPAVWRRAILTGSLTPVVATHSFPLQFLAVAYLDPLVFPSTPTPSPFNISRWAMRPWVNCLTISMELLAASGLRPPASGLRPSAPAFGVRPSAVGLRPSAFGLRLSASGLRPQAFGVRHLAIGLRPSAFTSGLQPLAFDLLPSACGLPFSVFGARHAGCVLKNLSCGLRLSASQLQFSGFGFAACSLRPAARGLLAPACSLLHSAVPLGFLAFIFRLQLLIPRFRPFRSILLQQVAAVRLLLSVGVRSIAVRLHSAVYAVASDGFWRRPSTSSCSLVETSQFISDAS